MNAAAAKEAEEAEKARVRKDRSESTTPKPSGPGPSSALSSRIKDMTSRPGVEDANRGKKVRV